MLDKTQPRDYSMGSGSGGVLYNTDSDGNLRLFKVNHDNDDQWLNSNYDNPDNIWNLDNSFVFVRFRKSLYFFIKPRLFKRGLRYNLLAPAAKHIADLVQFFRKHNIFFIIQ